MKKKVNRLLDPDAKKRLNQYLNGVQKPGFICLYKRLGGRGEVLRMLQGDGSSMIVKVWRYGTFYEQVKNTVRKSNGWREWRMHTQLYEHKIPVPRPLYFDNLTINRRDSCEIMMMEDLGITEPAGHYLNSLRLEKNESAITAIEDKVLGITENISNLGFIDIDNHLRNFLVTPTGRLVRIDFEVAHRPLIHLLSKKKYAYMMARLIESHVYAMQPEVDRTVIFAKKLYDRFNIDTKLRVNISVLVNERLANVLQNKKMIYSINLPM